MQPAAAGRWGRDHLVLVDVLGEHEAQVDDADPALLVEHGHGLGLSVQPASPGGPDLGRRRVQDLDGDMPVEFRVVRRRRALGSSCETALSRAHAGFCECDVLN